MNIEELHAEIESRKYRSAWDKGVTRYAYDLIDILEQSEKVDPENIRFDDFAEAERIMLNGAKDWNQYSYGGCSLVYSEDIAETLCSPSELKKRNGGALRPNRYEDWLDVQARALYQAARRVYRASKEA